MLYFLYHFTLLTSILYAMLMVVYAIGYRRKHYDLLPQGLHPKTTISVVVPARNEAQNITTLLASLQALQYPKALLEIIVVDDHSTDETAALVKTFEEVKLISMSDFAVADKEIAFKKRALSKGIEVATGALIVTTDADCIVSEKWLLHLAALYERQDVKMIIAPVDLITTGSVLSLFQSVDFMTMQGITIASHELNLGSMANGANLAFCKATFHKLGGYQGTTHLASGDDYLLLHKFKKHCPKQIGTLKAKDAIVQTQAAPTVKAFFNQRIRWASKSGKYHDYALDAALLLVYAFNVSLLFSTLILFADATNGAMVLLIWILKVAAESILFFQVAPFFSKSRQWFALFFLQPIHVGYLFLAGFLGGLGSYTWKGRNVH